VPSTPRTGEIAFSLWRTPTVACATQGAHPSPDKRAGSHSLVTEVKGLWPTPPTSMMTEGDMAQAMFAGDDPRRPNYREASLWPTPAVSDATGGKTMPEGSTTTGKRPDGSKAQVGLRTTAMWSTPRASDGEKGGPNQKFGAGGQPLPAQAAQAHGAMPNGSPEQTGKPGGLNPEFICWLMGFPAGWLD